MKKLTLNSLAIVVVLLLLSWSAVQAQVAIPVQTWDFETSLGDWVSGTGNASIELTTEKAVSGTHSVKMVKGTSTLEINLQNDVFENIREGDSISVNIWISAEDAANINGFQIFWQTGSGWSWNNIWINGSSIIGDSWNTIKGVYPAIATPVQRIGFQLLMKTGQESAATTIYFDDITISRVQTKIVDWAIFRRGPAPGWKFVPGDEGNAGVAGDVPPAGPWTAIRGGFPALTATLEKAVVVTGTMTFEGAGIETWNALRYAFTNHTQAGAVRYAGTDSARWMYEKYAGTDSAQWVDGEEVGNGYSFFPPSDGQDIPSFANGSGNIGIVRNSSWISTWGNNLSAGVITQKPMRAIAEEGTYDFAISVQLRSDSTKEVKFYVQKQGTPVAYWWGGSFIDTTSIPATFNGICFGLNGGNGAESGDLRGFKVENVQAKLGSPIVIPEAPWQPFYISIKDWGIFRRGPAPGWKFVPGEMDGNAGVAGDVPPAGPWTAIRGAFPEAVQLKTGKSIKISGTMTFEGAGIETWNALRYAFTNHTQAGAVRYAGTDSARWMYEKYAGTDSAQWVDGEEVGDGYSFFPPSDGQDIPSFANGSGNIGIVRNSSWISTWGNNLSAGVITQKPMRAIAEEGTYDFAISVQLRSDNTKEVKFYVQKQGTPVAYWWGGSFIDTTSIPATFNGICFGLNGGNGAESGALRGFYVENVQVDTGVVTVPEPPWQPFYISIKDWGIFRRGPAPGWKFVPGEMDGNAGVAGDVPPAGPWTAIRGAFPEAVQLKTGKSIKISGTMTFEGAGIETWNALRYAFTNHTQAGAVRYAGTDSARWMYEKYAGTDSAQWVDGEEVGDGYSFFPPSDGQDIPSFANGSGNIGIVRNSSWISTWGNNLSAGVITQKPMRAIAEEGTYDFAISVQLRSDNTKEVKFYVQKQGTPVAYWWGGSFIDTTSIPATFNGICFGLNGGNGAESGALRGFYVENVQVDTGVVTVPIAPWQKYYVAKWGVLGNRYGGWSFEEGEFEGNAGVVGTAPNTSMVVLRGALEEPYIPTVTRGLLITGQVEFTGGGFNAPGSFRIGFLYTPSLGKVVVDNTPDNGDSTHWDGAENGHTGILFVPRSGNNQNVSWGTGGNGSVGAILNADTVWFVTDAANNAALGNFSQLPAGAIANEGTYNIALAVLGNSDGNANATFKLSKDGNEAAYKYAASFSVPAALNKFNAISFALSEGNSTTALRVLDIAIDTTTRPVDVGELVGVAKELVPLVYNLYQNYPNPFNPTTTIRYDLPFTSNVKITVYDMLGREVARIVDGMQSANSYTIQWNASHLSSGVYFYRIDAKSVDGAKTFTSVKKLLLLK